MGCSSSQPNVTQTIDLSSAEPIKPQTPPADTNINLQADSAVVTRDRRADAKDIVQNFLLVWLDENIDESVDDFHNSIKKLRRTVNTIEIFRDPNECISYMEQLQKEKSFLIISGALCQTIVPRIHDMTQLYSIYVFCRKKSKYEQWAESWSKIKGVFIDIDSICNSVRESARQCDEDSVMINGTTSLSQIEPSFMYTQLFKEIILQINFETQKAIDDLVEYASQKYSGNDADLEIINEFAKTYRGNEDDDNKPVWWYSRECFTYHMLNKALGNLQVETLLKMGIFIRDLHQNLKQLHIEQSNQESSNEMSKVTVYRGKTMIERDFKNKIQAGGLMSFNNFLSTSDNRNVALHFIQEGLKSASSNNKVGVLFVMTINRSITSAPFARIDGLSFYPTENEILFSMHTVFRIRQITQIHADQLQINQVELTLTNEEDDEKLSVLTRQMREEIRGTGWQRMGYLLWKLKEHEGAEQIYSMLLQQATNDEDRAYCCNQLGLIEYDHNEYGKALEYYQRALDIWEVILPSDNSDLANIYNNIGLVHDAVGEYSKSLLFYERSLNIRKKNFPELHSDIAQSYNNIGLVHASMGNFSEAITYYYLALDIWQQVLVSNHPLLGICCNNIGLAYDNIGQYVDALSFFERSLDIREKTLPSNHPDIAQSYNNIGLTYNNMGDYTKALELYNKALNLWEKVLPSNHSLIAACCNNIGLAYSNMDENSKALPYHERALQIRRSTFGEVHADCAQSYNNIGLVYGNMGEYSKALFYYEKATDMWQKTLPETHPFVALGKRNCDFVKNKM